MVVFIWRQASALGRANPSKRAEFHLAFTLEFLALLAGLDLARVRYIRARRYECIYV